jgi:hypothetical protein
MSIGVSVFVAAIVGAVIIVIVPRVGIRIGALLAAPGLLGFIVLTVLGVDSWMVEVFGVMAGIGIAMLAVGLFLVSHGLR